MTAKHDEILLNQPKPTIEQAAWVLSHAFDHMVEGGSFRYLIYDRLGYGPGAYMPMQLAGVLDFSNLCPVPPDHITKVSEELSL
jgi:hypothetical protein